MSTIAPLVQTTGQALVARIEALAQFSADSDMLTRLTLTQAHRNAADMVTAWMIQAGMKVHIDALGTVVGRIEAHRQAGKAAKTLLLGSHIDTVRNAGKYDGNFGVIAAIAAVDRLKSEGAALPFAIEVLAFGDEEGVRYPSTLTGSRSIAGTFDPAALDHQDADGISRREALIRFGADPGYATKQARDPAKTLGYVEVHIEQGPVLESEGLPIGIVTAINGATRGTISITGKSGHSGTLPMSLRHDALTAAAEMILAIETIGRSQRGLVATVGQIETPYGAVNIVPGTVTMSLDVRSPSDTERKAAVARIAEEISRIAQRRGVEAVFTPSYDMPAAPCDAALMDMLGRSFQHLGHAAYRLASGAGHDAMSFNGRIPIAMIFARCRGGVSHNPAEFTSPGDMEAATVALYEFLKTLSAEFGAGS
ncbi:allantoate amidohydrolase [Methylocella sp. CPCC 101449]|jgi:allantoate deiminase|uniref:allantoate amidohydrolase n=1 Tax=Methylocella sp. CPCC 101449 TaxID=2987531 RepID=UPI00288DB8B6|nr:allantoate amidohydrolase [Methylocella sp. CPCC 101449]MDT2024415.1 allantoate amidohydrolase [Methylocella sp. CPCC 101449]HEV2571083.1 allantoate amidohydrolase [Beijerinckiaceae bacterium]